MKNYTLSKNLFNQTDEFYASLDLLEEQFPGILCIDDCLSKTSQATNEQKVKLKVLLAFRELFSDNNKSTDRVSVIQKIYAEKKHHNGDNTEFLLAKYLSVSEEFLRDNDVNILHAIEHGFLVAVNFVHLTAEECCAIRMCMNNTTMGIKDEIRNSIFAKLSGDELNDRKLVSDEN